MSLLCSGPTFPIVLLWIALKTAIKLEDAIFHALITRLNQQKQTQQAVKYINKGKGKKNTDEKHKQREKLYNVAKYVMEKPNKKINTAQNRMDISAQTKS